MLFQCTHTQHTNILEMCLVGACVLPVPRLDISLVIPFRLAVFYIATLPIPLVEGACFVFRPAVLAVSLGSLATANPICTREFLCSERH